MNPKRIKKLNNIEDLFIESITTYLKAFTDEQDKFLLEQAQKNMDSIIQIEQIKLQHCSVEFCPRSEITLLQNQIDTYFSSLKKEEEKEQQQYQ